MPTDFETLRSAIIAALRTVHDPEIPVNLYDLGLIYGLEVGEDGSVHVVMTLTTPNCPVADKLPEQVRSKVAAVPGVSRATIELTWEPPWSGELMSDDARAILDMMGISWSDPHGSVMAKPTSLTLGETERKPDTRRDS